MGYITRFKDRLLDDLYDLEFDCVQEYEEFIDDLHYAIDDVDEEFSKERWERWRLRD